MHITFDAAKNETNKAKHGFDFADLTVEFFATARFFPGNVAGRLMAIGEFQGRVMTVIVAPLGTEGVAVISMRSASRKERSL